MHIVIYVVLLLAGLAVIIYPFMSRRVQSTSIQTSPKAERRKQLQSEKEAVYAAIKDLDFEYKTGKLSDEDYAELRESYRVRALNLLKEIDAPQVEPAGAADETDGASRSTLPSARPQPEAVEAGNGPTTRADALYCSQCAHANPRGSRFCRACGAPLATELTCRKCATPYHPGDRFCSVCGNSL